MKKILLALCILLLAFPSWAASRVIQGDAQFVYSQEIDEAVNPKIGEEQEFVGFDPEGEPIYTTIPIYKYTSITSPTVTLGNVATIFPLNLDGMVFNVSYSFVSGKPGIYPGVFTFQFSKSEILMLPNGAVIMDEIENSTSPVDVLFKYFDPVFVIYGTDGDKVSINVKNFPLNFSFITGSYEDMAISFPVVLADGYPDTFCIEQVNGYLFVYDAMVSQENAGVISDGKIEVAFALVPNEKATNIARQDFPILELYEQGYVIFDEPSKYLNIPEMIGVSSAALSSGETSFVEIENGFSFTANTEAQKSATFVQCAIHSESSGIVNINGYPLETEEVLLPDGTKYLITKFVLVNGSFATGAFISGDVAYIFDGITDDAFTAEVKVISSSSSDSPLDTLFYHERGSFEASSLEGLTDQTESISGGFSFVELPLFEGMTGQISPIKFEATVDTGSSVFGMYEFSFLGSDVPDLDADAIREDINNIFNYIRPVLSIGGIAFDVYDYLAINGRTDLLSVSGSFQTGFSIKVPMILSDKAPRSISIEGDRLRISDGSEDGILVISSYIGVLERSAPDEPEKPLLSTQNIRLKRADLQFGLQEADAAFELAEATPWPGKEGVLAAIHVGSFVGTYEGTGKYVPLEVTISVTAEALQTLSLSGYNATLAAWTEDPATFFDYFHIYKQVGDFVYDLVMMGGKSAFTISGDPTTRINISFQAMLIDDIGFVSFDGSLSAFIIYDGEKDGKLTDPLFIGALVLEVPEDKSERPVLNSPSISLKLTNIDTSSLGLEEAEADFEYLGLTDWPGKEGVLKAVSVGSFEGEYDGVGKYVPLRMEVSVTSYDLDRLSKDRHAKVISKWSEDRSAFLDYFHVYKQTGDLIYDLVMMGGKSAFTISGDPTTRVTISFPAVLIDDMGNTYYDEEMGFVIYDGNPDGKLVDPLFVGTPEQVPEDEEEETKHILPDNPAGSSTGHSDLDKWIKIFSLF